MKGGFQVKSEKRFFTQSSLLHVTYYRKVVVCARVTEMQSNKRSQAASTVSRKNYLRVRSGRHVVELADHLSGLRGTWIRNIDFFQLPKPSEDHCELVSLPFPSGKGRACLNRQLFLLHVVVTKISHKSSRSLQASCGLISNRSKIQNGHQPVTSLQNSSSYHSKTEASKVVEDNLTRILWHTHCMKTTIWQKPSVF